MALMLATIDNGVIETGFYGPDTSKVQLGDLPPITIQQFSGFAISAARDVIPKLDPTDRQQWAADARTIHERVAALPTLRATGRFLARTQEELARQMPTVEGKEDEGEFWAALSATMAPTDEALYYQDNPFIVDSEGQVSLTGEEGVVHVISPVNFMNLAFRVLRGGMAGWNERGVYEEVQDSVAALDHMLSPYRS
jgi:hypothetical protein